MDAAHTRTQNTVQYDTTVRDLVNSRVHGRAAARHRSGSDRVAVFLGILFIFAYALRRIWKDVNSPVVNQ